MEIVANVETIEVDDTPCVRVQFVDSGKGIPPEERERIFKTFYRPHRHGNGRSTGSGLGLAICRGIVEAHHGHIFVEASPADKKQSCFTCILPVHNQKGMPLEQYPPATHLSSTKEHVPEESDR